MQHLQNSTLIRAIKWRRQMHAEDRNSESSFIIALSVALFAVFYSEKGSAQNSLELLDIFNPDALNSCGLGLNSNDGAGVFMASSLPNGKTPTRNIAIGDLNGDGVVASVDENGLPNLSGELMWSAGLQGIVSNQVINLNTLLVANDIDQNDTPTIDPDSIVITDNILSDAPGAAGMLNVSGFSIIIDTGQFDYLPTGDRAIFDVTFDIVSGADIVSRTVELSVNGTVGSVVNIIEGTINGEVLLGTVGNDLILGNGNADGGFEYLFGSDGGDILLGTNESEDFDGGVGSDIIHTGGNDPSIGDYTQASLGDDVINFGGNLVGFQIVNYGSMSAAITANLNSFDNTGSVDKGININLATGIINDDGFGNSETITGSGRASEIRGTDFGDTMVGSGFDDSFIIRGGTDSVSGGLGFDRVVYEGGDVGSLTVDLGAQTASGTWGGNPFTDTLGSIEWVRGGGEDDNMFGTIANERFEGQGGDDGLQGGGLDEYYGNDGADTVTVSALDYALADGGDGQDTLVFAGGGQIIDFTMDEYPETTSFERIDLGSSDGITTLVVDE